MGYLALLLLLVGLDQASKYMVIKNFDLYETKPLIEKVFHLTYVQNKGAAFSILENQQWFFILVTSLALLAMSYYFLKYYSRPKLIGLKVCLILIASGALGNLIDRIRFKYVVDFFDLRVIHFAIFNVADICVVVGAFILAFLILFVYKDQIIE